MKTCIVIAALGLAGLAWADELDDTYQQLKEAQEKKDVDAVKKLAAETSKLARAEAVRARPSTTDAEHWKERVEYAKQVDAFTEYALSFTAIQRGMDPAKTVELVDALLDQNPKSQYVSQCAGVYLAALGKAGGADKQLAGATKIVTANPNNEDALFTLTEGNVQKSPDRALQFANRLVTVMRSKAKPEGVSDEDWNTKKNTMLGHGYYVAGAISGNKQLWPDTDRNIRAALPFIGREPAILGPAYFYLGLADYQLGKLTSDRTKIQDGLKYSEESAKIAGPMQTQASRNAALIKQELGRPPGR